MTTGEAWQVGLSQRNAECVRERSAGVGDARSDGACALLMKGKHVRVHTHTHTHHPVNNVLTPASFSAVCSPPSVYATLHRLKAARGFRLIITPPEILHFIGDKCCEQIYKEIAAVIGGRDQTRCWRDQLRLSAACALVFSLLFGTEMIFCNLGSERKILWKPYLLFIAIFKTCQKIMSCRIIILIPSQ